MRFSDILDIFEREFKPLLGKFCNYNLSVQEAIDTQDDYIWHPGVYVWFHPKDGVLRVGRSLSNSRKRSLAHVGHNTGGLIKEYAQDSETRIFLFNVKDISDYHWVASLEIYFENELNPVLKSGRQG
ncbi:hypothetical protein [Vibrio ouci]|uniref:GIY-YIG nuclease family protein n=1 Tax=Vibrio ouci TaxID=2499078 RepID=A0A4Y8W991_9VIBR|nr:hypothetical protein [Vibrio ouci]TFH89115.1 hypothetical protein ELS82_24015 [Vibrio ouci]